MPIVALLAAGGCTDEMPTLSGVDQFPGGVLGTTIEHEFPVAQVLRETAVFRGTTGRRDAAFFMVARDFDGALDAHVLATFTGFPDSVSVEGVNTADFSYVDSRVIATVPDTLAVTGSPIIFHLWTVTQPWDTVAVSWENAVDVPGETTPWTQPGGTRGDLIALTSWTIVGNEADRDSLFWTLPAEVASRLASGELPGLMVTVEGAGERANISRLTVEASIRPDANPDTTFVQTFQSSSQTFIFSPAPPPSVDVLSVGGITSDRSLIRFDLGNRLPGCLPGGGVCPDLPAGEVAINRVDLLLDPAPVAGGFRPVGQIRVSLWQVAEPELGELAPLRRREPFVFVSGETFAASGNDPVVFNVTSTIAEALANDAPEITYVLLVEPEAGSFGYAWFERNPRLRFIYTLPQVPFLP